MIKMKQNLEAKGKIKAILSNGKASIFFKFSLYTEK